MVGREVIWSLEQIELSVQCKICGAETKLHLDDEILAFVGYCPECGDLVTAVVMTDY